MKRCSARRFPLRTPVTEAALAAILLALAATAQSARAMNVSPIVLEMSSLGAEARATLTIENNDDRTLSVELETLTIALSPDGEPSFTPEDQSLLVFPPVASIAPGRSQNVQIQYIGDPELAASRSFRVSVLQVPVAFDGEGSELQVVANVHTLVNVAPPDARAALDVTSIRRGAAKGEWIVEIRNTGKRHARLQETAWRIESDKGTLELGRAEILRYVEGSLVLPDSSRTVRLISPDGRDLSRARISISTDG